jgi:predicted alpha/beta hydrolase
MVRQIMGNNFDNIAKPGSGARLSSKLYREWHRKVKRHDELEALVAEMVAAMDAYQMAVDELPTGKHVDMMRRAKALLSNC